MKKFLAALLALSLTFGSVALPAAESGVIARGVNISASAETYEYGDFEYEIIDGTIEITRYTGDGGDVVIPSEINGQKVSSIGGWAFDGCSALKSITIPNGVTTIGYSAFRDCTSLVSITISSSVSDIDCDAFNGCSALENVLVDSENKYFSSESGVLFNKTKTKLVYYPEGNPRKEYTIPESVTEEGFLMFYNCKYLENITVDPKNDHFSSENGVLFNKDKTKLLSYPIGNPRKEYTVPSGVAYIGGNAFSYCSNLTSVTLSEGVEAIYDDAFSNCSNLTNITMPNSLKYICHQVFIFCKNLTNVTIPKNVESIDSDEVFRECSGLTNITVDPENEYFSSENGVLFNKDKSDLLYYPAANSRRKYTIPDSVNRISGYAFQYSNFSSITIPNSVEYIDGYAFMDSNITRIIIPDSVKSIYDSAFMSCTNLKEVYYTGSEDDWNNIEIGYSNEDLTNAEIHYNYDHSHIHLYTSSITKQPTCTEDGTKTFKCDDCGDTYTETIPANGHAEVIDRAVEATCYSDGKTEGRHCSVCGKVIKAQQTIKSTGHQFMVTSASTSSCTKDGFVTRTCIYCNKTETETIPAAGHKSSNWIVDKPAAIGVKGSKHKECTVCGKVLETAEIPALSKQNIQSATITLSKSTYVYDGKVKKPSVTVKLGSKTLKNGTDYTVSYSNNVKVGIATVKITGKGDYTGSVSKKFSIKNNFKQATITGISNKTYSGKSQTQKITVKFGGKTLKNGTDYTVSYSNNKKIGTASMKIVGKGDYSGTIDKTFKINPVKLNISKLAAKSKGFKASWAKNDQATGYEMQYSTDSKFKTAKKVAITKKTTTAKTITKLKASKKYYVRMRIYTTVNGKKYYGAWSAVKTVTTKK